MGAYYDALTDAMGDIAQNCSNAVFLGQGVLHRGHGMFDSFKKVPDSMKLELPVFEDTQLGMAIGMSLQGYLPVCIFPRWDFLICATNQLVNHLDKLSTYSAGVWQPRVLIRVAVGAKGPLFPGVQHVNDYTENVAEMLRYAGMCIFELRNAVEVRPDYEQALRVDMSSILVEYAAKYQE